MRCRAWNAGVGRWEGGDEDDFEALHRSWWCRDDFVDGGSVVLLRSLGLGGQPESNLWVRYGRVAERAGGRAGERGVVILRLREERARDWCAHEQVHVELVRDFRGVLSAVSHAWKQRIACLESKVQGVLGEMLGRAHVEVEPWDVGYGKERSAANLREHVKESLAGILKERQRANDGLLAQRLEEVKNLEEEEYVLVSTGGDRATLRDVRKRLRNARNAIAV